ncbi:ABC transporter ATP-binding protein [Galactobacter sp.]|uniref:dipeptide ABC transporter ATP-binding protein n=1 Tax=Galactobacter sp. TaxID=2676125 RepID=UPI0025B89936|nr:ABC transporter ATP-binding protein [Galactobacter sp.]
MSKDILFQVRDLHLKYRTRYGFVEAVRGVDIDIHRGERVALVGQSGSGKSTIASTSLGLSPRSLVTTSGSIQFEGQEILGAKDRVLNQLRGRHIGYVPQDPTVSLDPVKRIGDQVAEVLRVHRLEPKQVFHDRVVTAPADAGLDQPELRATQYPHELSGGLRQRVLIAISLIASPQLLIADEPTSALDVTVQKQILDLLDERASQAGSAQLLITHDLGVAADRSDRVLVMSQGRVVEEGTPDQVLHRPMHPYTQRLVCDAPGMHTQRRILVGTEARTRGAHQASTELGGAAETLRLQKVTKEFPLPGSLGGGTFPAVAEVDLTVARGRTTGLVGESGSGKTTTGRIALRLEEPTSGKVLLHGEDITAVRGEKLRQLRRRLQIVQQNPFASLNPKLTVSEIVEEPLASFGIGNRKQRRARAADLIDQVALPGRTLHGRADELSGGQRQRVAIARALALEPEFILLDEPVSALDVSVQSQILDLLVDLQREHELSYLFISHDLAVVRDIAHEINVIRQGRIVEANDTVSLFEQPHSDYTKELLAAIPGSSPIKAA